MPLNRRFCFFGCVPKSITVRAHDGSVFSFERAQCRFPLATPVCIRLNTHTGSIFSASPPALIICDLWWWPFRQVWGNSHCGFCLHFANDYWCWASLHVPVGRLCAFLEKYLLKLMPSFWSGCLFFGCLVAWAAYFVISPLSVIGLQVLSPVRKSSFILSVASCCAKASKFSLVSFVYFLFCFALGDRSKIIL